MRVSAFATSLQAATNPMPLPVVFAWSGGKDSAMALHSLLRDPQYQVISLLTTVTEGFERISMHGVRCELLYRQAQAIGLSVEEVRIPPQCPNSIYESRMAEAVAGFHDRGVRHFAFGDIFLQDLRAYRERNLARLEMAAVFPLWALILASLLLVLFRTASAPSLFASILANSTDLLPGGN